MRPPVSHWHLVLACLGWAAGAAVFGGEAARPALRVEADPSRALIRFLSWDTEGGPRAGTNLLRPGRGVGLRLRTASGGQEAGDLGAKVEHAGAKGIIYHVATGPGAGWRWEIASSADWLRLAFHAHGAPAKGPVAAELVFPFDPRVTTTTVLPARWGEDGRMEFPVILSAPDFGQMVVRAAGAPGLRARLEGSRAQHAVDFIVELPDLAGRRELALSFRPLQLAAPRGLRDTALWRQARRGWFGAFQPSAQWGDAGNPFSAPPGMLANNVVSDPASCSLWFYADQAFWTPQLAPGVSVMPLVRRTLDWWLGKKVLPSGEMICYWDKAHFLDANAGPLIAAWDYLEATGDTRWLTSRVERLEFIADYLAQRDVDGDGLVEAVQSGNAGTLIEPARSCAWWDALNCGHKDSYSNALIYRAWRCLADLEAQLGRESQRARYGRLADRLKAAYVPALLNPQTGWLAWWRSADGALHDYASPVINGLAIEYGLVPAEQGRQILARLRAKMHDAGFVRFDLGVPPMLEPVRRADYLLPDGTGSPGREDGADTFGYYMNGGITAGQVLHFLAAHYVVGENAEADRMLRAMLGRQAQGGFQNGAVNAYPKGVDWTTWDGRPSGYEGYLADSFRFLQAVLLREARFRAKLYRPLGQ